MSPSRTVLTTGAFFVPLTRRKMFFESRMVPSPRVMPLERAWGVLEVFLAGLGGEGIEGGDMRVV